MYKLEINFVEGNRDIKQSLWRFHLESLGVGFDVRPSCRYSADARATEGQHVDEVSCVVEELCKDWGSTSQL